MLETDRTQRVLEIGTGSGYQAAVLSPLVKHVYSIEIVPELTRRSTELLKNLGFTNVTVRQGDGYLGWPEEAPFERIILTAAPGEIPKPLINQLKADGKIRQRSILPVRFVPMGRGKR